MRYCLRILAPRYGDDFPDVVKFVELQIARGEWFPALRPWEAAILFYPHDANREEKFCTQINAAIKAGELIAYSGDALTRGTLAAWVNCPPVPLDSPLIHWLPAWMRATATTAPRSDAPSQQDDLGRRRFQQCIEAGLKLPDNSYGSMPPGVGALARQEGVSTEAFSKSVKRYLDSLQRQP